jgi:multicomponent Na+:H+ antiporter subunit B
MSTRARAALFAVAAAGLAVLLAWGVGGLPAFGRYPGPYGDRVARLAVPARHATNATTTVVMDVRAVDTAGEELILFAAVVGLLMLLRTKPGEVDRASPAPQGRTAPSTPVRITTSALVAPAAVLGLYVVAHGQITPGGGFQGGVLLAAPSVLVLLAGRTRAFDRLHRQQAWETAQSVAVTGFLVVGLLGLVQPARAFLANFLPLGSPATVFSAGTIPVLNVLAGVAVATAVVLVIVRVLHQVTAVGRR